MPTTIWTLPLNDTALTLASGYTPGSGILYFDDLSGLPGGFPSASSKLRLSIDRNRDGAKTILIATGRSGLSLTGVTVAEGKIDIPLDAGDVAKVRISSGYITDLQTAVNALESGGVGAGTVTSVAMTMPAQFVSPVSGSPVTTSGTLAPTWAVQNANKVLSGPTTGADAAPTFRALVSDDLPTFTNTVKGAVPVPSPAGGSTKYLREDATWDVPPGGGGMSIGGSISGGTANRILYEGAGPVLADSGYLTWDGTYFDAAQSGQTGSLVPLMTSDALPVPLVASANAEPTGFEAYRVFDGVLSTSWYSPSTTGWCAISLGRSRSVTQYQILGYPSSGLSTRAPKAWTFDGSTNGSSWVTLHSVSGETSWTLNEVRTYTPTSSALYSHYRINITDNNGDPGFCQFGALTLTGPISFFGANPYSSTLTSNFIIDGTLQTGGPVNVTGTSTITTQTTELILEETGDTSGTVRLRLRNRPYFAGPVFENPSGPLVDFAFMVAGSNYIVLRYNDYGPLASDSSNSYGEFQFLTDASHTSDSLSVGSASVIVGNPGQTLASSTNFAVGAVPVTSTTKATVTAINATDSILATVGIASQTGPHYTLYGTSSTPQKRPQAQIDSTWVSSTDASRTGRLVLSGVDYAGIREGIRIEGDGSAARIGFLGANAAIQQTGGSATASGTWTATEQSMLQKAYDCLRTFGLLT